MQSLAEKMRFLKSEKYIWSGRRYACNCIINLWVIP